MTAVLKGLQDCLRTFCAAVTEWRKWVTYEEQMLISDSFGTQAAQDQGSCMLLVHVLRAIPLAEGRSMREPLRREEAGLAW